MDPIKDSNPEIDVRDIWFVYILDEDRMFFYAGNSVYQGHKTTRWSPRPSEAKSFPVRWEHTDLPNGGINSKCIVEAEEFARVNSAKSCCGDPKDLLKVHEKSPKVGERVRVTAKRSDGYNYGTGVVEAYAGHTMCSLTHVVVLDNPPKFGAPNELGEKCRDQEILARHNCFAWEIESLAS